MAKKVGAEPPFERIHLFPRWKLLISFFSREVVAAAQNDGCGSVGGENDCRGGDGGGRFERGFFVAD